MISFSCIIPDFCFPFFFLMPNIFPSNQVFKTLAGLYQIFEWPHAGVFSTSRPLEFPFQRESKFLIVEATFNFDFCYDLHTAGAPEIWIDQSGLSRREKLYCPDVNVS